MIDHEDVDIRAEPYLHIRDHRITSFEDFDEFKEKFPDCSDALVPAIWAQLMKDQHKVSFFDF